MFWVKSISSSSSFKFFNKSIIIFYIIKFIIISIIRISITFVKFKLIKRNKEIILIISNNIFTIFYKKRAVFVSFIKRIRSSNIKQSSSTISSFSWKIYTNITVNILTNFKSLNKTLISSLLNSIIEMN